MQYTCLNARLFARQTKIISECYMSQSLWIFLSPSTFISSLILIRQWEVSWHHLQNTQFQFKNHQSYQLFFLYTILASLNCQCQNSMDSRIYTHVYRHLNKRILCPSSRYVNYVFFYFFIEAFVFVQTILDVA